MGKLYIIAHSFKDENKDYADFYNALKNGVDEYRHIMNGVWVVKTDKKAAELRDMLMPFMTFQERCCDLFFISELGDDRDGMIAKSYWEFFKKDE